MGFALLGALVPLLVQSSRFEYAKNVYSDVVDNDGKWVIGDCKHVPRGPLQWSLKEENGMYAERWEDRDENGNTLNTYVAIPDTIQKKSDLKFWKDAVFEFKGDEATYNKQVAEVEAVRKELPSNARVLLFMELNNALELKQRMPEVLNKDTLWKFFGCDVYIAGNFQLPYNSRDELPNFQPFCLSPRPSAAGKVSGDITSRVFSSCKDLVKQASEWQSPNARYKNMVLARFSRQKMQFRMESRYDKLKAKAKAIVEEAQRKKNLAKGEATIVTKVDNAFKYKCPAGKFVVPFSNAECEGQEDPKVKEPKALLNLFSKKNKEGSPYFGSKEAHSITSAPTTLSLKYWSGKPRSPSQVKVMQNSPNELAKQLGLGPQKKDKKGKNAFSYEWLHLSAFSFGKLQKTSHKSDHQLDTQQQPLNLVLGTAATNTRMIIEEEGVKRLVRQFDGTSGRKRANVYVWVRAHHTKVTNSEYAYWLANKIQYQVEVKLSGQNNLHPLPEVIFSPWMTTVPSRAELFLESKLAPEVISRRVRMDEVHEASKKRRRKKNTLPHGPPPLAKLAASPDVVESEYGKYNILGRRLLSYNDSFESGHILYFAEPTDVAAVKPAGERKGLENSSRNVSSEMPVEETVQNVTDFAISQLFGGVESALSFGVKFGKVLGAIATANGSSVLFEIIVKLDSGCGPLAPLAKVFEWTDITVEGLLEMDREEFQLLLRGQQIQPRMMSFRTEAVFKDGWPVAPGLKFLNSSLSLMFFESINLIEQSSGWAWSGVLTGSLRLHEHVTVDCSVKKVGEALHVTGSADQISLQIGEGSLALETISLDGDFNFGDASVDISAVAIIAAPDEELVIGGALGSSGLGLYTSLPKASMKTISWLAKSVFGVEINPKFTIDIDDLMLGVATSDLELQGQYLRKGFTISMTIGMKVGFSTLNATVIGTLSKDGIDFEGHLENYFPVAEINVTKPSLQLELSTTPRIRVSGSAEIKGVETQALVALERRDGSWDTVLHAQLSNKTLALDDIITSFKGSNLTKMIELNVEQAGFIYSSKEIAMDDDVLAGLDLDKSLFATFNGGLMLYASVQVPKLFGLLKDAPKALSFSAVFSASNPHCTMILTQTNFQVVSWLNATGLAVDITFGPPALALTGNMQAHVFSQDLEFDVSIRLDMDQAVVSGTAKVDTWKDVFGVKGLHFDNFGLEGGINYAGIPSDLAIAGGVQLGAKKASMAFKVTEEVNKILLKGTLQDFSSKDLVQVFQQLFPTLDPPAVPDFFQLRDLNLYIAPSDTNIGSIQFKQGFSFDCDFILLEKERFKMKFGFGQSGISAEGQLPHLQLGPLDVHGAKGEDAKVDLVLNASMQRLLINAELDLLASNVAVLVNVSNKNVMLHFNLGLPVARFEVTGKMIGNLNDTSNLDFLLEASYASKFVQELTKGATDALDSLLGKATTQLDGALRTAETYKQERQALQTQAKQAQERKQNKEAEVKAEALKLKREQNEFQNAAQNPQCKAKEQEYQDKLNGRKKVYQDSKVEYDNGLGEKVRKKNNDCRPFDQTIDGAADALAKAAVCEKTVNDAQRKVDQLQGQINNFKTKADRCDYDISHCWFWEIATKKAQCFPVYGELSALWLYQKGATATLQGAKAALQKSLDAVNVLKQQGKDLCQGATKALHDFEHGDLWKAMNTAWSDLQNFPQQLQEYEPYEQVLSTIQKGAQAIIATTTQELKKIKDDMQKLDEAASLELKKFQAFLQGELHADYVRALKILDSGMKSMKIFLTKDLMHAFRIEKMQLTTSLKDFLMNGEFHAKVNVLIANHSTTEEFRVNLWNVTSFKKELASFASDFVQSIFIKEARLHLQHL